MPLALFAARPPVSWFIALRYLSSRFITFASFLLVSLAVAILIILLAVMEGFKTELIERVRGTSSDINVTSTRFVGMDDHAEVRALVEGVSGVRATVPFVETLSIFSLERFEGFDHITGHLGLLVLDLRAEAEAGHLDEYVRRGAQEEAARLDQYPGRLSGTAWSALPRTIEDTLSPEWVQRDLWRLLRRQPPEDIDELRPVLLGSQTIPRLLGTAMELKSVSPVTNRPCVGKFVIAGYFKSRDAQRDAHTVLMDLDDAREFLALAHPDSGRTTISGFRVFLDEGLDAGGVKESITAAITSADIPFVVARTWREEKSKLLRAVQTEKALVGLILGAIILLVGLMIFIIMTVQIVQKTRDLGILQAIGMTPRHVVGVYLRMGTLICVAGVVLGTVYGVLFCFNIDVIERWVFVLTGKEVFPQTMYYLDGTPARPILTDFLFIVVPTVLFGFLASLLAANRAARQDPLEALRYE